MGLRLEFASAAMFAAGLLGTVPAFAVDPLPMPSIPLAAPDLKLAAGVTAPIILPSAVPVPELKAPPIAPPSELPAPALPTLVLPPVDSPEVPKLELPKPLMTPLTPPALSTAPVPPVHELPAPALANPAPITPPLKAIVLPKPSMHAKPELKLPEVNSAYNAPLQIAKPGELAPMPSPAPKLSAPGEDTVKLNPTNAIKSAVAGAIMATAPAAAEEPKVPAAIPATVPTDDVKALETELKAQILALKNEIKSLKEKQSTYDDLIAGRADGKVNNPIDAGLMKRVENLEVSVKRIEDSLKNINDKLSSSTSAASPLSGVSNAMPGAGKSKVRLVNEYPIKVSIVVNGTSYPLEAKQLKDLEVPAGSFSYQLLAEGTEKVSSTIKEGETVTLRIR